VLQLPLRKTEYPENMMTMMKKMKPYLRESSIETRSADRNRFGLGNPDTHQVK
jgi:hypothetical protein